MVKQTKANELLIDINRTQSHPIHVIEFDLSKSQKKIIPIERSNSERLIGKMSICFLIKQLGAVCREGVIGSHFGKGYFQTDSSFHPTCLEMTPIILRNVKVTLPAPLTIRLPWNNKYFSWKTCYLILNLQSC